MSSSVRYLYRAKYLMKPHNLSPNTTFCKLCLGKNKHKLGCELKFKENVNLAY